MLHHASLGEPGAELLAQFVREFGQHGLAFLREAHIPAQHGAELRLFHRVATPLGQQLNRLAFPHAAIAREQVRGERDGAGIERMVQVRDTAQLGLAVDARLAVVVEVFGVEDVRVGGGEATQEVPGLARSRRDRAGQGDDNGLGIGIEVGPLQRLRPEPNELRGFS